MQFDSYDTPDTETLLQLGRQRHLDGGDRPRLLLTEAAAAAAFLVAAGALAVLGSSTRSFSPTALVAAVVAYLVAAQVRYPVGSAWTGPMQLVFVPMLFVLPTPFVPLIIGACSVADQLPQALRGHLSGTRALARVGDSFYSLGPALVLVLFGGQVFSWRIGPCTCSPSSLRSRSTQPQGSPGPGSRNAYALGTSCRCCGCTPPMGACRASASLSRRPRSHPLSLTLPSPSIYSQRRQRLDFGLALSTAYRGTATLLGYVVEADDQYTGAHSRDVVDLSRSAAAALGLGASQRRAVEFVAMLHDVGKIFVPKGILNKPGELDAYEWEVIRQHTIQGERLLKQVGGALARVARYVRSSHEHYDGHGYPDGLAGESIPIESRIVTVCDAYSAMTTDRPYRAAMQVDEALEELRDRAGTQFDPQIVRALERVLT